MKPIFKTMLLSCTASGLLSCAPVDLLNTITPAGSFDRMSDVSFADHSKLKLDVYRSGNEIPGSPVLMFVHGGGWEDGSKDIYKFIGDGFAKSGYTTVIPNYRVYPEARFPDTIADTAQAASWASTQFPDRSLILIGHSAGAYNVLMTGLDPDFMSKAGGDLCANVAGIISLAGPTGIVPLEEEPYITVFPDRFTKSDAPLNIVKHPSPPFYLLHGADDTTVYPQNSQKLSELVKARGGIAEVKIYDKMDHIEIVQYISRYFDGKDTVKDDIIKFIESQSDEKDNYCQ